MEFRQLIHIALFALGMFVATACTIKPSDKRRSEDKPTPANTPAADPARLVEEPKCRDHEVYLDVHVAPIVRDRCQTCHNDDESSGGVNFVELESQS